MTKSRVTFKKVKAIADKIAADGGIPSVKDIVHTLGADSNTKTIQQHLAAWQSQQAPEESSDTIVAERTTDNHKKEDQKTRKELEESLALVRATLESTTDGILVVNNKGEMLDFNKKFMDMWNLPKELTDSGDEMKTLEYGLTQVEDPEKLMREIMNVQGDAGLKTELGELRFKDGRIFERYSQPHKIGNEIVGRVWSFRDVTERRRAEETLRLRDRAIEASTHGVIITDITQPSHPVIYANPAFEKITGYSTQDILGRNCNILQGAEQEQPGALKAHLATRELREEEVVLKNFRKDGTEFWTEEHLAPVPDANGKVSYFVRIITDITERRKMEQQLLHQATHDILTDLPNRSLLLDRIEQSLIRARRERTKVALLFFDLDKFKLVNDSLGHTIGDKLIQEVSARISGCIRESDTLARLGGDEFIVLFSSITDPKDVTPMIEKIMLRVNEPYYIEGHELHMTTSIGISFYPDDGKDAEALIKNADMSMYQAKDAGRNTYKFYTEEINKRISQQMKLATSLHGALERGELLLNYQPLINVNNGQTTCVEALIRWQHPEYGMVSPAEFIPIAEDTGKIIDIGKWVLKTACLQAKKWHEMGLKDLRVAVNLSGRQFRQPNLTAVIAEVLQETGLDPKYLELELTESMLIEQVDKTINTLKDLKKMGILLAIDDFGTGYSSLNYLKQFPVDILKVDRSFIQDLTTDANDAAITLSVINLAHSLNLIVVAEGVEMKSQVDFLRSHGCDEIQGYFFSRPIPVNECTNYMLKK